jgi:nicotinate-nucleotide pyrophosphorylase (carboxylating)
MTDLRFPQPEARHVIDLALREDVGPLDLTTEASCPAGLTATAVYRARQPGVFAGGPLVPLVFQRLAHRLERDALFEARQLVAEGDRFDKGAELLWVRGEARLILTGERVSLNLLQRLTGIATLTREHVDRVAGTRAKVLDTRKTTPGLRALEKYAVRAGGGTNHRMGLYDEAMLKDNHFVVLARRLGKRPDQVSPTEAIEAIRDLRPGARVTIEADTLVGLRQALPGNPDVVLLDNMNLEALREGVAIADAYAREGGKRPALEASGGVNLETSGGIASTGVDRISVGALTHSAKNLDIGLDFVLDPIQTDPRRDG